VEAITLVRVVGTILCVLGILLCWRLRRVRFQAQAGSPPGSAGKAPLAAGFWKLLAFTAFVAVPAATVSLANYHTFQGVHQVRSCASCHVMLPMVNDMIDSKSDTLAARHFKNHWIPRDQCFECHSDYGLGGDLDAKLTGFRHLARYTTHTYSEPIAGRIRYNNGNCLKCHDGQPRFEIVTSHQTAGAYLKENSMSCLNCHGKAHPTRAQRTPGSPDYDRLMEAFHE
jgi:trimethylamine-N-oxide reductase (cytochrome c), cytochrome c-type subunit TorC